MIKDSETFIYIIPFHNEFGITFILSVFLICDLHKFSELKIVGAGAGAGVGVRLGIGVVVVVVAVAVVVVVIVIVMVMRITMIWQNRSGKAGLQVWRIDLIDLSGQAYQIRFLNLAGHTY